MVEARGKGFEVPLANKRRLVSRLLEELGEGLLRTIELAMRIVVEPVLMAMLAGNHAGTARATEGVRDETIRKQYTLFRNAVEVGRMGITLVVATHHLGGVVVRHDVHDVERLLRFLLLLGLASGKDFPSCQRKSGCGK